MRRVVVIEHEPSCPLDLFESWLEGIALDVVRPYAGAAVPPSADDGLIVLGGRMSAHADERAPWLPAVRDLLATSVADGVPTLGICLGAQLLAVACGGTVEVGGAPGRETGVIDVNWLSQAPGDPLVAGLPDPMAAASMHADAVTALPPDAVWLASSAMYPHQAFRVGAAAWGVQFHPEASPDTVMRWAAPLPDDDKAAVSEQLRARADEAMAGGRALARGFASLAAGRPRNGGAAHSALTRPARISERS
jgi:GMP synthase (glutamine-hydrolysing)